MIPYGRQTISESDCQAVLQTLRSDWLTQGPAVPAFETALTRFTGAKYAVAVNNGTAGLHLAYLAAGLKAGDEVITTANTFVATTNMLIAIGAKPVFCDIRTDTLNIDATQIEQLITKKTKAIIPVHFAGQPVELQKIKALARRHKLLVIEDACHALGASYRGKPIGGGQWSDMAVFSFHPVKSITTGEGGAILTNNKRLYEKIKLLRSHGITKDKNGFNVMTALGFNYRLTDIQAALGTSQLKQLKKFVRQRTQVARWYLSEQRSLSHIILPTFQPDSESSWHLFVIRVKDTADRLPLYAYLLKHGVGVNFHYPVVYNHPWYRANGYLKNRCPNAELYEQTAITIPLFPTLKREQIAYICKTMQSFFN